MNRLEELKRIPDITKQAQRFITKVENSQDYKINVSIDPVTVRIYRISDYHDQLIFTYSYEDGIKELEFVGDGTRYTAKEEDGKKLYLSGPYFDTYNQTGRMKEKEFWNAYLQWCHNR